MSLLDVLHEQRKRLAILQSVEASYRYGTINSEMLQDASAASHQAEKAHKLTQDQVIRAFESLLGKLPRCETCQRVATHHLASGQYLCQGDLGPHLDAKKVPWYGELEALELV